MYFGAFNRLSLTPLFCFRHVGAVEYWREPVPDIAADACGGPWQVRADHHPAAGPRRRAGGAAHDRGTEHFLRSNALKARSTFFFAVGRGEEATNGPVCLCMTLMIHVRDVIPIANFVVAVQSPPVSCEGEDT